MIPGFVSVYKSKNDGLPHIYFYPGYDDYDRNIYRIDLSSKQYLDYKYVKNQDRSIEYIIINVIRVKPPLHISYKILTLNQIIRNL